MTNNEPVQLWAEDCTDLLRRAGVPTEWGIPDNCTGWFNIAREMRAAIAHFSNGRSASLTMVGNRWNVNLNHGALPQSNAA